MYRFFRILVRFPYFPLSTSRKLFFVNKNIPEKNYTSLLKRNPTVYSNLTNCISQTTLYFDESIVVLTPQFADSIKEGDIKWQCKVGDFVDEDDILGEIETDKTSIPILAPFDGKVQVLFVSDGDTVVERDKLYEIKRQISDVAADPLSNSSEIENQLENLVQNKKDFVNTEEILPISEKVQESISEQNIPPILANPISNQYSNNKYPTCEFPSRSVRRVKMSRMRLKISERLKESQNTTAMLTTFNEVNVNFLLSLREQYKEKFLVQHGVKLGIMSPFIKAVAYALTKYPLINAVIENGEILYRDYIDISVAISTTKGLVVPIIRDVITMNYFDIENRINELTNLAQKNLLAIDDLYGGTFTISNGGIFGSLYGTPIINPPQSAILGMHGIKERPIAINGKIEIMPMMYLALTYDHRLIDGREAVLFLKKIVEVVENPFVMLLDI